MRNWVKRGMALLLTGMVILAGAEGIGIRAQAVSGNDTQPTQPTQTIIQQVPVVQEPTGPSSTSEFLAISDQFKTPTVTHGEKVTIGLPIVNYSTESLKDVIVKAKISNLATEWPFVPDAAGATKTIKKFPAYDSKKNIEDLRQELGFSFVVREDVKSGYYKLEFDVTYLRNDQVEKCVLTTYVKAVGTEKSGTLENGGTAGASDFLAISDQFRTPTVTHGTEVTIGLPIVNYSTEPLKDVVVKPRISNQVSEWPFVPDAAGATKTIQHFPAYDSKYNIEDMRQELGFTFKVREDVKSGYYKLEFDVTYVRNEQVEKCVLTTFVKAVGAEGSGSLEEKPEEPASTSEFLALSSDWQTPTVTYGQSAMITLPVVNYSAVPLEDVILEPKISNLVAEWPFEPNAAAATRTVKSFPGYDNSKKVEELKQDVVFPFTVREDVKSGYYKLEFDVTYMRNNKSEKGTLTTYVKTVGKEGSGTLDPEEEDKNQSKPRIIVTGFETNPAQVYAGSIFTLKIHVKNTSATAEVTNVLFDMQAKEEGKDADSKFAAFLPTSGASSVYVNSMAPGASKDLVIEMSAKSDLSQKPYVLDVNMKYDAKDAVDLTDTASVSIPIYQEQRCETGDASINPTDITVGGQANITFDIYNTGKTTLYNVWVKFKGDSITGGDSFLGTLASGATGSVDAMVTGQAATADDGAIKALISYENESGVVTTVEKDLQLFVTEEMAGDFSDPTMGGMPDGMETGEVQGGGVQKFIVPIVIAVIVLIIAAVVVVKRIRRKKKEREELEADLRALDD